MQDFLDDRTQLLNDADFNKDGKYVVYWMQLYKRSQHNRALNKAIEIANALGMPVVVYEGLKFYYPWASDRIHSFILEGINEKREAFSKMGIRYVFYLQENDKSPKNTVEKIAKDAAALVTEDYPCFVVPGHNGGIAKRVNVPVFTVDDNGIVPMRLLLKEQFAARTIRPRINRLLPDMENLPQRPRIMNQAPDLKVDCPETVFTDDEIPSLLKRCDIDHSVPPVPEVHGGEKAARARLQHVIRHVLPIYEDGRNKPDIDGSSRLSPYMHFGMLSAGEIREAVVNSDAPQGSKDAFLEELIIRRELSFNFCHYNPQYATLDALPDWAKKTMAKHDGDKRAVIYTEEQLEAGETGDTLWNATQHELVKTGRLHNYMRMLWGKKIIEWMPDYESAFNMMEHLNNKYALDGRDPNSYAGILWCFGKHDRAWGPERPVFGTLRYLSSDSWRKKVNAKTYIAKYGG